MGGIIFEAVLIMIFIVISTVLLSGHGAFLISGYNTSSKKDREKYDEKKLCRSTGVLTLLITVMLIVLTILSALMENGKLSENDMIPFAIVFVAVIVIGVIFMIYYTNTRCFKK